MKKEKCIILILLVIIIILIGSNINFILQKNSIVKNNKQTIKEMNESTQITDLNNQINALNTEHSNYMNYIEACKTAIATALTTEGVTTSNQATLETMTENISKVLEERTKDATATADDIAEGKTAYINGEKIIGNVGNFNTSKFEMVASDSTGDTNKTISYTATEDCYLIGFTECESRCMRAGQNYTSSSISLSEGCENLYNINKHNNFWVSKSGTHTYENYPVAFSLCIARVPAGEKMSVQGYGYDNSSNHRFIFKII